MSSQFRFRRGNAKPTVYATEAAYPIEIGDLLFKHTADDNTITVRPASALPNFGSAVNNREAFKEVFAGVALTKDGLQTGETAFKPTTRLGYVMVAEDGEFEFECAAKVWQPNERVGVYASSSACSNQVVAAASGALDAIGLARPGSADLGKSVTKINVEIRPAANDRGIEAATDSYGSGQ
jgi:hypothetical protein